MGLDGDLLREESIDLAYGIDENILGNGEFEWNSVELEDKHDHALNVTGKEAVGDLDRALSGVWKKFFHNRDEEFGVISEEDGVYMPEDPDYVAVIDEVDSSKSPLYHFLSQANTNYTLIKPDIVEDERIVGKPVGSFISEIENDLKMFCYTEDDQNIVSVEGKSMPDVVLDGDEELPGQVNGRYLGPDPDFLFEDLFDNGHQQVTITGSAHKKSRRPVMRNYHEKMMDAAPEDAVNIHPWGGSVLGASVGLGETPVMGELKPTYPHEMAGGVFTNAMGGYFCDIDGRSWEDGIEIKWGDGNGEQRTYNGVITYSEDLAEEVLDIVDTDALKESYDFPVRKVA